MLTNAFDNSALTLSVVAGTATDTRFGLEFLAARQMRGIGVSLSASPQAQTQLQALERGALTSYWSTPLPSCTAPAPRRR